MKKSKVISRSRGRAEESGTQLAFSTDDQRWFALRNRDEAADGRFVYSVATTGVFCRPNCPSKLPRREHVSFYETSAAARRAGFRPCKRCQPEGKSQRQLHAEAMAKACRIIETSDSPPSLAALAEGAGLSPYHFQRVFKRVVGVTPREYGVALKTGRARTELRARNTVTEAIYGAGYGSSSRFYERANETLGMTPREFRQGGGGVTLRFAIERSQLGLVLVAGTARGICAVQFGDDRAVLERGLRREFPRARVENAGRDFNSWVKAVVAHIEAPARRIELPLDIRGTAFQHRVWQALRKIPAGATSTYAEIAATIGNPRAVRAVGRACAANPVAVVVPCHRVVRSDGNLSGYRWGIRRKRELLRREGR